MSETLQGGFVRTRGHNVEAVKEAISVRNFLNILGLLIRLEVLPLSIDTMSAVNKTG